MLNLTQIKEMIKENFGQINITFNSSDKIEIFDPSNPQKKLLAEEKSTSLDFFELEEKEIKGFEDNQLQVDCKFISSIEKEMNLKDLALSIL